MPPSPQRSTSASGLRRLWSRIVRRLRWWWRAWFVLGRGVANKSGPAAQTVTRKAGSSPPRGRSSGVKAPRRFRWLRWLATLLVGGALAGGCGVAGLFLYYGHDPDLPRFDHLEDYQFKVVTKVTDKDGELIGEIYEERRTVVPRDRISPHLVHALVDAEDAQFYEHKGLNYWGMLRAFLNNLRPGAHLQGASTLTQQLVKNILLKTNERTLKRKVQEMILARRLETALTKDEILTLYLNQIEFGHQRFGVEEAARFYFGKSVFDVSPGEAAVLASIPKGPTEMDPWKHPDRIKDRQRYVLSQMLRYDHISRADADYYANAPIQVVRPSATVGVAPEFVDEAKKALIARYGEKKLPYLGTTVVTTCDSRIQKLAREALERNIEDLDGRQKYREPRAHLKSVTAQAWKGALEERSHKRLYALIKKPTHDQRIHWQEERAKALAAGKTVEAAVVEVRPSKGDSDAGVVMDTGGSRGFLPLRAQKDRYNPKSLPVEKRYAVGDLLWVRAEPSLGKTDDDLPILVPEFGPQAAALVIDPETREIRAMVGGYGFHAGSFNRAIHAHRQPGSSFKPFLYAAAFNSGKFTPATVMNDSPQAFYDFPGVADWWPKNAESHEFLGPVRLRVALAKSLNTVASRLLCELGGPMAGNPPCGGPTGGAEPMKQLAQSMGIESKLETNLSLGIGSFAVTLAELTNAYTTFATLGKRAPTSLIRKIGDEVEPRARPEQAITPEIAYLVTSLMESVIDEGTAASAKSKLRGRPAAGKTGTTNSERDAWFIGFTPDLVVGVWVGFDDMRDLGHGEQGARSALPIWVDIVNGTEKGVPARSFTQPAGIVVARIDPATGLLAQPGAANAIDEKFLQGTAPTELAPQPGEQNPDNFITDQPQ